MIDPQKLKRMPVQLIGLLAYILWLRTTC